MNPRVLVVRNRKLRYDELVARGVIRNRTTLYRWIRECSFPPGQLIGPNTRVWDEAEVDAWLASRPPAGAQPPDAKPPEDRKSVV